LRAILTFKRQKSPMLLKMIENCFIQKNKISLRIFWKSSRGKKIFSLFQTFDSSVYLTKNQAKKILNNDKIRKEIQSGYENWSHFFSYCQEMSLFLQKI
jgi:hypothetical protein